MRATNTERRGTQDHRTSSIVVRLAATRDVHRVAPLFDAYRVFYGQRADPRRSAEFLAARVARRESVVLLAMVGASAAGGEVAGFAQMYRSFSSVSLGVVFVLNDLYVVPEARRLGVGGRLVDAAAAHAKRAGALWLQLEAHPDNAPALRLYRAKGFVAETEFAHLTLQLAAV